MPLAAGVRLGPYEITDWIAAGGMGDVYRGRDTRKNGGFVRNTRIDRPTRLRPGDQVRFGLFTFVFRLERSAGSTETA